MIFPMTEKSFVQILNVVRNGGCASIQNEEMLESFAARTMTIYKRVIINDKNTKSIIKALYCCSVICFCETEDFQKSVSKICDIYFQIRA